jgi:hypothetical protein
MAGHVGMVIRWREPEIKIDRLWNVARGCAIIQRAGMPDRLYRVDAAEGDDLCE